MVENKKKTICKIGEPTQSERDRFFKKEIQIFLEFLKKLRRFKRKKKLIFGF